MAVHLAAQALWPAYRKTMRPSERRQFCNKVACGLHVSWEFRGCGGVAAVLRRPDWCIQGCIWLRRSAAPACLLAVGLPPSLTPG